MPGIRARSVLYGFPNHTQQELMLLYDPDVISARHDPQGPATGKHGRAEAPRFDGAFRIDLDIDATEDVVTFSKPPLEAALDTPLGAIRLIGVHVKSKAPHGATTPDEAMSLAIANRRKQLAQCIWLRRRIDAHLAADEKLIVAGDLNDGPGLDDYERLFGRSGVEIVMGGPGRCSSTIPMPNAPCKAGSRRSRRPRGSSSRTRNAGSRRFWTTSWSRPPCARRRGAGASGIHSTIRPAGAIPSCAMRFSTPRTISP
jgi:hypothetical protein